MLLNLKTAMITHRVSAATICRTIGITPKTMSCKVNEKRQFTRTEMYRIHDYFFKDEDFYELFKSDEQKDGETQCQSSKKSSLP